MSIFPDKLDHFSYLRGRNVLALFTIVNTISPITLKGFQFTTKSINREFKRIGIPVEFAIFSLPDVDENGKDLGSETLYVSYPPKMNSEIVKLLYLEYSNRLIGMDNS